MNPPCAVCNTSATYVISFYRRSWAGRPVPETWALCWRHAEEIGQRVDEDISDLCVKEEAERRANAGFAKVR